MPSLADIWASLRAAPPVSPLGDGYRLQLAGSGQQLRVYAGLVVPSDLPALVVELPQSIQPTDLSRISTRAFEAEVAELPGLPSGHRAVLLKLTNEDFTDLFAVLGEEIRAAVVTATSATMAYQALSRCIERWRRFVERGRRRLTDEEVRGLVGELVVLARVAGKIGIAAAVSSWRGPTGTLRDFELPNCSVEVKTFQSDTGASVRINDPEQLDIDSNRPVLLAAVRLAVSQASGAALPDFIRLTRSSFYDDALISERFETLLSEYGYMDAQASMYEERYLAGPVLAYQVADGFPRIAQEDVPAGVVDVRFSLQLSALAPFQVEALETVGPANPLIELGHP